MSFYSLFTTGSLVGEEFCYHEIPEHLDPFDGETFSRSAAKFYVTCTNLETGRAEYIRIKDMTKGNPLSHGFRLHALCIPDRGSRRPETFWTAVSPTAFLCVRSSGMGMEKNLVILTRPEGYQKEAHRVSAAKAAYRKYPEFIRALRLRPRRYNAELEYVKKQEESGRAFVLRPSVDLHIGRMERDPERLMEMYQLGRKDAETNLAPLQRFLAD